MAVGKNFLENLTVAMYENSFTVYREFVQNAADSIDKAIASKLAEPDDFYIDISIEYSKRRICVYDNACGIPIHLFKKKMLDVADSDKDRDTEKGFRGIGRLAGLGYCDKLIFRTTSKGEDKESIITWDGVKLKEIVDDPTQHPSSEELINTITEIEYKSADEDDHFFEVIMEDVIFESDDLLDEEQVIKYLQAVSPVPYANYFIFSSKIQDFANENNFKIGVYNDNSILDTTTVVYDLNKNEVGLSEILTDKPCLIIRFAETNCEECVRFLLIKVMRLYNSDLFNKRILLFASYPNRQALKILVDRLNIKYPVYLVDKLPISCERINFPYCFMLDSTMRTSHVFVPDKYEPQIANTYFELIENRYFK